MGISFKPFHGQPYQKFVIVRIYPSGKMKRIGRMLAPNLELAIAKAGELWDKEPEGCTLVVETAAQLQARFQAAHPKKKKKKWLAAKLKNDT